MIIQDNFGKGHACISDLIKLSYEQRVKRGLKAFGTFFAVALGCVLIPVLHFFLVPLFLFLSVFQGIKKFKQTECFDLSKEFCPICKKTLGQGTGYFEGEILRKTCPSCKTKLIIQ